MPESEVFICGFYLYPFFATFQHRQSLSWASALCGEPKLLVQCWVRVVALPPASEDFCEPGPCSAPVFAPGRSPPTQGGSPGKNSPCPCFESSSTPARLREEEEEEQRGLG